MRQDRPSCRTGQTVDSLADCAVHLLPERPPDEQGEGVNLIQDETQAQKRATEVALFQWITELSSGFPSARGSDHQWWSGRQPVLRPAWYAVPSSRPSRPQRLST